MSIPALSDKPYNARAAAIRSGLDHRSVVLIGMMGAGKSSIGRRLATALEIPFSDADVEIERAAGMTIEDMFRERGESYFREGEMRVIGRLLTQGPQVLATGGGAVINRQTRKSIRERAVSIWLNAPLDLLLHRVSRRDNRPLLKVDNPREVMAKLLTERVPYYQDADIEFVSRDTSHDVIVDELTRLIETYLTKARAHG